MSKLQTTSHKKARTVLRRAGLATGAVGLLLVLIGISSFFAAFGGGGPPNLFWCAFAGIPLLFAGTVMCLYGFLGSIARYTAAEQVPVATDAVGDLAEGTQDAAKTMARAVAQGVKEGLGKRS